MRGRRIEAARDQRRAEIAGCALGQRGRLHADRELQHLERAWSIGIDFPVRGFSIDDRTSFAVMQRLGVLRVAPLDDDFAIFRFGSKRERAF